ncbi:uncharacterized protein PG998_000114 [Apiospora kogelbergensis]|uniref:uncharacterized protein n=1 Tax=Apiospora kogelbergensis TaxID=1337665 RepID=UPI00312D85F2
MTFVEGQMRFAQRSALLGLIERKTKWDSQVMSNPDEGKKQTYMVPCYLSFGAFADHDCSDPRDKFYALLGIVEEDMRQDTVPDYRLRVHRAYQAALAAGFRSIMANLRDSSKIRLEALGILAEHLHETFGLLEKNIIGPRAAALLES